MFCRIARREAPATIVGETDGMMAFADLHPQAPTHLLIIPTDHLPALADATNRHETLLGRLLLFASHLARQFQLVDGGYRVVINSGAGAGQTVFHLHLHLLGGRHMQWPPG